MFDFAQILPGDIGTVCTLDYDQSIVLANAWFVMLAVSLILAIGFSLLKKRLHGVLFAIYVVILLLAKLLNPVDECRHGGLFKFTEQGLIGFAIISLVIFATIISGGFSYWKSRSHTPGK